MRMRQVIVSLVSILILTYNVANSFPAKNTMIYRRDTKCIRTSNILFAEMLNNSSDSQSYLYVRDSENRLRNELIRSIDDIKTLISNLDHKFDKQLSEMKEDTKMQLREMKEDTKMQFSEMKEDTKMLLREMKEDTKMQFSVLNDNQTNLENELRNFKFLIIGISVLFALMSQDFRNIASIILKMI